MVQTLVSDYGYFTSMETDHGKLRNKPAASTLEEKDVEMAEVTTESFPVDQSIDNVMKKLVAEINKPVK